MCQTYIKSKSLFSSKTKKTKMCMVFKQWNVLFCNKTFSKNIEVIIAMKVDDIEQRLGEQQKLDCLSLILAYSHPCCVIFDKIPSVFQFCPVNWGNNSTHLIMSFWRLQEIIHIKCLKFILAHNKHLRNINYYYFYFMNYLKF